MKKILVIIFILFLTGCTEDKNTLEKNDYLVFKEKLLEQKEFTNKEDLVVDLNIYTDRVNDEEIAYRVIIDNPKENMYDIKAIVVHNYFTDSIFPSIGIFDSPVDLIVNNDKLKGINLSGYINTTKDIKNLEVRVYLEYKNEINETKVIYYKTTI